MKKILLFGAYGLLMNIFIMPRYAWTMKEHQSEQTLHAQIENASLKIQMKEFFIFTMKAIRDGWSRKGFEKSLKQNIKKQD